MEYQDVIALFKEDLRKGLAALYEQYGRALYGFAVTHFHINEEEGYDVLYQTLETVGKVITRYEFTSEKHFANWLFKIHKNNIFQLLRTKKSREPGQPEFTFGDWEAEMKDDANAAVSLEPFKNLINHLSNINPYEDNLVQNHLMSAMEKALQSLPDTERDLLLLRMNDYSYDEIAAMLGIENNQLKVKFLRAKAKVEKKTLAILKETYNETAG